MEIDNEYLRAANLVNEAAEIELSNKLQLCYDTIYQDIEENGLDNKYGLVELFEALMSAETYYNISKLIIFPEKTVVVDCGCNAGIQQVFFKNCYKYIGMDIHEDMVQICTT